ncbi:hypothetical protein Taro_011915 [Colocasia esculenta]|uniref:J domain-containing protein n=1 Tax=Colocasia esculenta TaxID=4460 RepID=A0A843UBG4_COLES|nr:hypothetical protein [Colocasia esculenta]
MLPEDQRRRDGEGDGVERGGGSRATPWRAEEREEGPKAWAIVAFALIGATATTYAVGQLRRSVDFVWSQSQPFASWKNATGSSSYGGFREEAWRRYNRRLQEAYEEEMERVERIRRMQSVFNRERNKYNRSYESWREHDASGYHQHFQRDDWYWKTDTTYKEQRDQRAKSGANHSYTGNYTMSHHYSVLGLDRTRTKPYTDAEIKQPCCCNHFCNFIAVSITPNASCGHLPSSLFTVIWYLKSTIMYVQTAFRAKAMEYHPDQNQNNKEAAEAKFKEVMTSYEAIKLERKNATFMIF